MFTGLTKYMFGGVLAVAFLVSSICYVQLKVVRAERDSLRTKVSQLSTALKEQNTAIDKWQQAAQAQNEHLIKAEKSARLESEKYTSEAQKILQESISHRCDAAIEWAKQQASKLAHGWSS